MDILTQIGIKISIMKDEGTNSKYLIFDRPVQIIELTNEEAAKLGSSMIKDKQIGITTRIRKLIYSGFFKDPKSFREIKQEFQKNDLRIKSSSLNVILIKFVERNELIRIGKQRSYLYSDPRK